MDSLSKKNKPQAQAELTFDDVLILPGKSNYWVDDDQEVVDISTKVSKNLEIETPITSSPMPGITGVEMVIALGKIGGLGFLHPFQSKAAQLSQAIEVSEHGVKFAASVIDVTEQGLEHVGKLLEIGVDLICVETAHAHNKQTLSFIRSIKKEYPSSEICASLVVTKEAVRDLIKAGVSSIRVGIGGGSHCTTRLVTGIGRPQLTAVKECSSVAKKYNIPIISDTGIRYAGDIVKALVFGADAVMIGGLFAGTDECPGNVIRKNGQYYKYSWGMATQEAWQNKKPWEDNLYKMKKVFKKVVKDIVFHRPTVKEENFEEGVKSLVPYRGSVEPIIRKLNRGIKRSMWYAGVDSITDLRKKAQVVLVTPNTVVDNSVRVQVSE